MSQTQQTAPSPMMREVILTTAGYVGITTKAVAELVGIDNESARAFLANASRRGWVTKERKPNRFKASTYTMTKAGRDAVSLPASLWGAPFSMSDRLANHTVVGGEVAAELSRRYGLEVVGEVVVRRYEKVAEASIASAEMEGESRSKALPRLHRGDLAVIRADGSIVGVENELSRKSQSVLREIVAGWGRFAHPTVYLIPRGSRVESDVRRAIAKASETNPGVKKKVIIQCLEDLLEGEPMPGLDALMSGRGTRQQCKATRPRPHNQSGRKRTVTKGAGSKAKTRR
jgi:hypothetical protein